MLLQPWLRKLTSGAVCLGVSLLIGATCHAQADDAFDSENSGAIAPEIDGAEKKSTEGQTDLPRGFEPWLIQAPYAWNRTDGYAAPDFEGFFPDDAEGGKQLDQMLSGEFKVQDPAIRLAVIRRGLRQMSKHPTTLLGSVGNRFVWNCEPQDPRAIELLYHASACDTNGIAHSALYHGPTVVTDRTPNLVRTLMQRYHLLSSNMQHRIAWGMRTYGDQAQSQRLLLEILDQHESLATETLAATLNTYEAVFETDPPDVERFADVGHWLVAWHRTDISATHPQAARLLEQMLDKSVTDEQKLDWVLRVDGKHAVAVALVRGVSARDTLLKRVERYKHGVVDFSELLSIQSLERRRLREFAEHLPGGLPSRARPAYTRPPALQSFAHLQPQFVPPDYQAFFPEDTVASKKLDQMVASQQAGMLSDQELLELFRRGLRKSKLRPNSLFGWLSGALGWPKDPRLTEIQYQALAPTAPAEVRHASIYYSFGLGTEKTPNILRAMVEVFMAPPWDRTTNYNSKARILWGVRDHEDDKHQMAQLFAEKLQGHAQLSDVALQQVDSAYQQLTDSEPPNADDYANRGLYVILLFNNSFTSSEATEKQMKQRFGKNSTVLESVVSEIDGQLGALVLVRGFSGVRAFIADTQNTSGASIGLAELLSRELVDQAANGMLEPFRRYLADVREAPDSSAN